MKKVTKAATLLGGLTSEAKAAAARENGKLGGRPRKKGRKGKAYGTHSKIQGGRKIGNNENQQINA